MKTWHFSLGFFGVFLFLSLFTISTEARSFENSYYQIPRSISKYVRDHQCPANGDPAWDKVKDRKGCLLPVSFKASRQGGTIVRSVTVHAFRRWKGDQGLGIHFLGSYMAQLTQALEKYGDPNCWNVCAILKDQLEFMTAAPWRKVNKEKGILYFVDAMSTIGDCGENTRPEALLQSEMAMYYMNAALAFNAAFRKDDRGTAEEFSTFYLGKLIRTLRAFQHSYEVPGGVMSPGVKVHPQSRPDLTFKAAHPYSRGSCKVDGIDYPRVALNQAVVATRNVFNIWKKVVALGQKEIWPKKLSTTSNRFQKTIETYLISMLYSYAFAPDYPTAGRMELPSVSGFLDKYENGNMPHYWWAYGIDLSSGEHWNTSDLNYCLYNSHSLNGFGGMYYYLRNLNAFRAEHRVYFEAARDDLYAYSRKGVREFIGERPSSRPVYQVFLSEINPKTKFEHCPAAHSPTMHCTTLDLLRQAFKMDKSPLPFGAYTCQGPDGVMMKVK